MKIKNEKDFWSGVMFLLVGLGFVVFAQQYDFGTPQRMGPAFFPTALGGVLMLLGLLVGLQGISIDAGEDGKIERLQFGPLAWVVGSIVLFGLIVTRVGLMISLVIVVFVSMYGSHEFKWKEAVGVALVMSAIVYGVFVIGLKLTIPVWPPFLTR